MLLPILFIAVMAFYGLQQNSLFLEHMINEVVVEIPRVAKLKILIVMAEMPPNDYLISGNQAEQNTFGYYVQQIDEALCDLQQSPSLQLQDQLPARQIQHHWQNGKLLAQNIFARNKPQGDPQAAEMMTEFDAQIGKAIAILDQLEISAYHDIEEEKDSPQPEPTPFI
jgi:hypothetical protein